MVIRGVTPALEFIPSPRTHELEDTATNQGRDVLVYHSRGESDGHS
jgi:hypothetical protein